jgi:hypothetical protein
MPAELSLGNTELNKNANLERTDIKKIQIS